MARCALALWRPVDSHGGPMAADLGCVEHVTTNHGDPFSWFANRAHQASSHFWIADDGTLEQYVDTDLASWAQAAGNRQYVSVETSGTPDQPLTAAQVAAFATLYRWGHQAHGWPYTVAERPGDAGFGWHGMGGASWGSHFGCPGDLRKAQRPIILAAAQQLDHPASPAVSKKVTPMFSPSITMEPVAAAAPCPTGGFWLVSEDGDVYAFLGAPYKPWPTKGTDFAGRKAANIRPGTDPSHPYVITDTVGEDYAP